MFDRGPGSPFDALEHDPAAWLAGWIADPVVGRRAELAVRAAMDTAGPERGHAAITNVRHSGPSDDGNPADDVLRAVLRAWIGEIGTSFRGDGVPTLHTGRPTVLLSNHLSYVDTTATDRVLVDAGATDLADRLQVLAGPKVWDTPLHALATRALNVVPTVQSQAVGGESARAAAVRLLRGVALARSRLEEGSPLLIYPEGTRSRTGRLGPFLKGVRHYLTVPDLVVVPIALWGTDRIYPIDADRLHPGPVCLAVGEPIPVDDPEKALVACWEALARMLPEPHRPSAGMPPVR